MDLRGLCGQSVLFNGQSGNIAAVLFPDDVMACKVIIALDGTTKEIKLNIPLKNGILRFQDEGVQRDVLHAISAIESAEQEAISRGAQIERETIARNRRDEAKVDRNGKLIRGVGNPLLRGGTPGRNNIVFKASFCDGGEEWFRGPCSPEQRALNCAPNARNCTHCRYSECARLSPGEPMPTMSVFGQNQLCYESRLFVDFKLGAGRTTDDKPKGWNLCKDCLVIVTTCEPEHNDEEHRLIAGVFLAKNVTDVNYGANEEAMADAYDEYRLALTREEARELPYWDYAPSDSERWGSGLFRFIDDKSAARILLDVASIYERRGGVEEENAKAFVERFLEITSLAEDLVPPKR